MNTVQMLFVLMLSIGLMNHVIIIPVLLEIAGRNAWISTVIGLILLVMFLPLVYFPIKQSQQTHIFQWLKENTGAPIAYFIASVTCIYLLIVSIVTLKDTTIMISLFEIFKEAGMWLPIAIGQTLSVVGGLIIGQAAINAGLSGPGTLVVMATSVIATFTLANQSLAGTVSILRFIVLAASSMLGLFGFVASMFFVLIYVANLTSFV